MVHHATDDSVWTCRKPPNTQGVPPVTRTFNTLMIACNTSGQWQQALEVHREMRGAGHPLNTTSYNALISAHSKSGHLDQVLSHLPQHGRRGVRLPVLIYNPSSCCYPPQTPAH